MKKAFLILAGAAVLTGCAVPTTGAIPRQEGLNTVTRQGAGFWEPPQQLTAKAVEEGAAKCSKQGQKIKVVHVKEIPAGAWGRWPESEVLFKCE